MNFENRTPFLTLLYDVIDESDQECHVLVVRGTFSLIQASPSANKKSDATPPVNFIVEAAAQQAPIAVIDVYHGELNRSSVKHESDLAPGKPKCDVIIVGSAHSPTGGPVTRVEVGVRIQRTVAIPPFADVGIRLDHRLIVHGKRAFERRRAILGGGWRLTEPEPFLSLPLRYEHAFGGELKVYPQEAAASKLRDQDRLSDAIRARHPEGEHAPIAHTLCMYNPLGVGWLEGWYADAASIDRWAAPQIEAPEGLLTVETFERMVRGEVRSGERPELTPRGMGVIAKPWQPRLPLAGTLDDRWLAERWPHMPRDYQLGYWNGAHPEMQCAHLFGGEMVELWNLLPPSAQGISLERDGGAVCRFRLPDPVVAARLKQGDKLAWGVPVIDTLILDLDEMCLSMVWRMRVPIAMGIEAAALVTLGERPVTA